jgi:outer membrane protein assembly factor BamB
MKKLWIGKVLIILLLLSLTYFVDASLTERGSYTSREVLSIYVEDIDDDSSKEVIAFTKSGTFVLNSTAGILWKYGLDRSRAIYIDDVNKDDKREVIISAGDVINNMERGSLYILSDTGEPIYNFEYMTGEGYPKFIYYSFVTADLSGDGYKEFIGGGINGVYALRDTYDRITWSFRTNETMIGMRLIDRGGGSSKDILANSYMQLYAFSLTGSLINNTPVAGGISKVYTEDLRNTSGEEIFVLTDEGTMYLFDETLRLLIRTAPVDNPLEAAFFDLGDNNSRNILIGSKNGVYLLDDRFMVSKRFVTNESVHGLYFLDWDNDNEKEILCSSGDYIYSLKKDLQLDERYDMGHGILDLVVSDLDSNGLVDAVLLKDDGVFFYENNESGMDKRARAFYVSALGSVELKRYGEAGKNIEAARKIYTDLGDLGGIKECDDLERRIMEDILNEKIENAGKLFQQARTEFAEESYDLALLHLNQSKAIYLELNDTVSAEKCDNLTVKVSKDQETNLFNENVKVDVSSPKDVNILPVLSILLIIIISVLILGLMKKK